MQSSTSEISGCTFWIARKTQPFPEIATLPLTLICSCKTLQHCVLWAAAKNGQFCSILATCFHLLSLVSSCDYPESQIGIRKLITTWSGSVFCHTDKLIQINYIVAPLVDAMERSWRGHTWENEEEDRFPFQWQLTDLIQRNKKLYLKTASQYIF